MSSQTNEEAFESHIEKVLLAHGFYRGENSDFNKEYAINEKRFWDFLESTQKEELEKLKRDSQYKGYFSTISFFRHLPLKLA